MLEWGSNISDTFYINSYCMTITTSIFWEDVSSEKVQLNWQYYKRDIPMQNVSHLKIENIHQQSPETDLSLGKLKPQKLERPSTRL